MPGVGAVPMLGPVGAPAIASPVGGQIAQAAGEFPQMQQQYQMQQAELDAQNMSTSSQRLALLNKLVFSNKALAGNPQMVSAYEQAFGKLGIPAPTTMVNGQKQLDLNALQSFGPAQDFISQNLDMLIHTDPSQRAAMIEAATGQAAPQGIIDALGKLPRKYLQSPGEASALLSFVKTSVGSLGKPGGSIDNVIASIQAVEQPLSEVGINADILIENLKPDLYAQLMQKAQLDLMQAKTSDERAKAESTIKLLPEKIAQIKTTDDLKRVMEDYYPAIAAARTTSANAAQERADTDRDLEQPRINELRARTKKEDADADDAHQRAVKTKQEVTNGTATLKEAQTSATVAQQSYDRLEAAYAQAQADVTTYKTTDPAYAKQLEARLPQLRHRMEQAAADAAEAQQNAEAMQHNSRGGANHAANVGPNQIEKNGKTYYKHSDGLYYTTPP